MQSQLEKPTIRLHLLLWSAWHLCHCQSWGCTSVVGHLMSDCFSMSWGSKKNTADGRRYKSMWNRIRLANQAIGQSNWRIADVRMAWITKRHELVRKGRKPIKTGTAEEMKPCARKRRINRQREALCGLCFENEVDHAINDGFVCAQTRLGVDGYAKERIITSECVCVCAIESNLNYLSWNVNRAGTGRPKVRLTCALEQAERRKNDKLWSLQTIKTATV